VSDAAQDLYNQTIDSASSRIARLRSVLGVGVSGMQLRGSAILKTVTIDLFDDLFVAHDPKIDW
jgi:hypothetical protein